MSEEHAPDVQPEGQGDSGGSDLYNEALSSVPEDYRQYVEPHFKQWDQNVQRKFQEAAQYRDQWKPYEELRVHEHDPQQLAQLLEFSQSVFKDEESFDEWLMQAARDRGILETDDDLEPEQTGFDPSVLQPYDQRLQMVEGFLQQQAQQQQLAAADQEVQSQVAALHEKHGDFPDDMVGTLALRYVNPQTGEPDPDALDKGFADYQKLISEAEKGILGKKLNQPSPANPGGPPDTNSKPVVDWKDASAQAKEMLRQHMSGS